MNKIKLFTILALIFLMGCAQKLDNKTNEFCLTEDGNVKMSISEAKEIAMNSECGGNGSLKDEYYCNTGTSAWWIELEPNVEEKGCNPSCIINVNIKNAEINWRCTGLLPVD